MTDLLTICILTLNDREQFYKRLRQCLDPQVMGKPVRIITVKDNYESTIGAKRNAAVDLVQTEYMCRKCYRAVLSKVYSAYKSYSN